MLARWSCRVALRLSVGSARTLTSADEVRTLRRKHSMNTESRKTIAVWMMLLILAPITGAAAGANTPRSDQRDVASLPGARAGANYEYQFQSDGGLPPLTWRLVDGELPPGLKVDSAGT